MSKFTEVVKGFFGAIGAIFSNNAATTDSGYTYIYAEQTTRALVFEDEIMIEDETNKRAFDAAEMKCAAESESSNQFVMAYITTGHDEGLNKMTDIMYFGATPEWFDYNKSNRRVTREFKKFQRIQRKNNQLKTAGAEAFKRTFDEIGAISSSNNNNKDTDGHTYIYSSKTIRALVFEDEIMIEDETNKRAFDAAELKCAAKSESTRQFVMAYITTGHDQSLNKMTKIMYFGEEPEWFDYNKSDRRVTREFKKFQRTQRKINRLKIVGAAA